MFWNESQETISRDELAALQGSRLVKLVKRMYKNTEYYREKMKSIGLEPEDIRGIEDLSKLPFTTKDDLRKLYPYGMQAVLQSEIVRYHISQGASGVETVMGYTRNDINIWSECVARCIYMAGISREDILQVAYNYGMFSGGLGAHYGAEKVGAAVIPMSIGSTEKFIDVMESMGVTGIMCTPSYLKRLAYNIKDRLSNGNIKLKTAICGGELWSAGDRQQLEELMNIKTYDIYGLGEMASLGVAGECECHNGMHVQEDYFITELMDGDSCIKPNEDGHGELVFTTLHKEGVPLIRYRTGDYADITYGKCECGRTLARISNITRGEDGMFTIRGNSIYPARIKEALEKYTDNGYRFLVKLASVNMLDTVEVEISTDGKALPDNSVAEITCEILGKIMGVMPESCVFTNREENTKRVRIQDLRHN